MKKLLIIALGCLAIGTARAQSASTSKSTNMQSTTTSPKAPVQAFFSAFSKGDLEGLAATFHDNCTITAVRPGARTAGTLYGTYAGKAGVRDFVAQLGATFDTKAFSVDHMAGEGDVAFASGSFSHIVKATGKAYASDWSLMCVIRDGKILEYHFYEDSARYAEASKP
jgi:hypothetical protein